METVQRWHVYTIMLPIFWACCAYFDNFFMTLISAILLGSLSEILVMYIPSSLITNLIGDSPASASADEETKGDASGFYDKPLPPEPPMEDIPDVQQESRLESSVMDMAQSKIESKNIFQAKEDDSDNDKLEPEVQEVLETNNFAEQVKDETAGEEKIASSSSSSSDDEEFKPEEVIVQEQKHDVPEQHKEKVEDEKELFQTEDQPASKDDIDEFKQEENVVGEQIKDDIAGNENISSSSSSSDDEEDEVKPEKQVFQEVKHEIIERLDDKTEEKKEVFQAEADVSSVSDDKVDFKQEEKSVFLDQIKDKVEDLVSFDADHEEESTSQHQIDSGDLVDRNTSPDKCLDSPLLGTVRQPDPDLTQLEKDSNNQLEEKRGDILEDFGVEPKVEETLLEAAESLQSKKDDEKEEDHISISSEGQEERPQGVDYLQDGQFSDQQMILKSQQQEQHALFDEKDNDGMNFLEQKAEAMKDTLSDFKDKIMGNSSDNDDEREQGQSGQILDFGNDPGPVNSESSKDQQLLDLGSDQHVDKGLENLLGNVEPVASLDNPTKRSEDLLNFEPLTDKRPDSLEDTDLLTGDAKQVTDLLQDAQLESPKDSLSPDNDPKDSLSPDDLMEDDSLNKEIPKESKFSLSDDDVDPELEQVRHTEEIRRQDEGDPWSHEDEPSEQPLLQLRSEVADDNIGADDVSHRAIFGDDHDPDEKDVNESRSSGSEDNEEDKNKIKDEEDQMSRGNESLADKIKQEVHDAINIDLSDPQVTEAATKIQAAFKGYKARNEMKNKK